MVLEIVASLRLAVLIDLSSAAADNYAS